MTEPEAIEVARAFAAEHFGTNAAPEYVRFLPQMAGPLWIVIYSVAGGNRVVAVRDSTGQAFEKPFPDLGFPK